MHKFYCDNIVAVVISFNPEMEVFEEMLSTLLRQVGTVVIVDNGSTNEMFAWNPPPPHQNLHVHRLGYNSGIAHAQNIGIEMAFHLNAEYVMLMDQDSRPASDMSDKLRCAVTELERAGVLVGAVGPDLIDSRQTSGGDFLRKVARKIARRLQPSRAKNIRKVDSLIASGSLIPLETFSKVGLMRAEMFIDYVDHEWAHRANHLGYHSFLVRNALMDHSLGENPLRILGKSRSFHSPVRHYYMVRNAVWLYRQRYVPLRWSLANGRRLLWEMMLCCIFVEPRRSHLRMMVRGACDGAASRLGPANV